MNPLQHWVFLHDLCDTNFLLLLVMIPHLGFSIPGFLRESPSSVSWAYHPAVLWKYSAECCLAKARCWEHPPVPPSAEGLTSHRVNPEHAATAVLLLRCRDEVELPNSWFTCQEFGVFFQTSGGWTMNVVNWFLLTLRIKFFWKRKISNSAKNKK